MDEHPYKHISIEQREREEALMTWVRNDPGGISTPSSPISSMMKASGG